MTGIQSTPPQQQSDLKNYTFKAGEIGINDTRI